MNRDPTMSDGPMSSASWQAGMLAGIHNGVTEVRVTLGRIETKIEGKAREPLPWPHVGPMAALLLLALLALTNQPLAKELLFALVGAK